MFAVPASVALPDPAAWPADGTVAEWFVADGGMVHAGDPVCRFETDFVSFELEAEGDGILRYHSGAGDCRPPDGILAVILAPGEPLAVLDAPPAATLDSPAPTPAASSPDAVEHSTPFQEWRFAAPPLPFVPRQVLAATSPAADGTVLRFPRPPAHELADGSAWDTVPGDGVDFATALTGALTPAPDPAVAEWVESRPEPGPMPATWENGEAVRAPAPSALTLSVPVAAASASVLFIRVTADLAECHKMCEQLAKEWDAAGIVPRIDDIVVRALARALRELPAFDYTGTIALRSLTPEAGTFRVLDHAGSRPFRDAVAALAGQSAEDAASDCDCVVTSFTALGIEDATPRLDRGRPFALAIGATRKVVTLVGDRLLQRPVASLVVAYDAAIIEDCPAARLVARVRELIESPYALLAE